jgi:adenine-specific DNA-methyltransferase
VTDAGPAIADVPAASLSSNEPEQQYAERTELSHRKKHGQFFTPFSAARFMSQWITEVNAENPTILDPCAGLGVFERAICETDSEFAMKSRFFLWEKEAGMSGDLADVCQKLTIDYAVNCKDFINEHDWSATYDAVIANPPYYKHHFVENKEDVRRVISEKIGAPFSVQTNIYCWFLIKSLSLLKPGGRLAFIIPTEFLNANYGRDVKNHLLEKGYLRHIISVCYKSKTFGDAITTACVLLAEKGVDRRHPIRFYSADSPDQFGELSDFLDNREFIEYGSSDLDIERKWRTYFPGNRIVETGTSTLVPFSTYGRFSRGIATGANKFFAIRPSLAEKKKLPMGCLIPCVSKARQVPQRTFRQEDFEALKQADQPVFLFNGEANSGDAVRRYIRSGESCGYQDRYLTRTRKPWYALEKRQAGKIWAGVFGREGIRFIWNESKAITLTCFHVFQPSEACKAYLPFLFLYLNSATGRDLLELEKREYGDGLEKYEPNDINKAWAPDFSLLDNKDSMRLIELQKAFIAPDKGSADEREILAEADRILRSVN